MTKKQKKKTKKFEIGQEVYIINKDLTISQKNIVGFKQDGDKIRYELDVDLCQGIPEEQLFETKRKAEVEKQNFLDSLKFKVGDLIVFEYEKFGSKNKYIGRISDIKYSYAPYKVEGSYREFYDRIADEDILLKVRNDFIENYENLKELTKEFKKKEKEMYKIIHSIHEKHDKLEKELQKSVGKEYSIFNWSKEKPKFKDRFSYKRDW